MYQKQQEGWVIEEPLSDVLVCSDELSLAVKEWFQEGGHEDVLRRVFVFLEELTRGDDYAQTVAGYLLENLSTPREMYFAVLDNVGPNSRVILDTIRSPNDVYEGE